MQVYSGFVIYGIVRHTVQHSKFDSFLPYQCETYCPLLEALKLKAGIALPKGVILKWKAGYGTTDHNAKKQREEKEMEVEV